MQVGFDAFVASLEEGITASYDIKGLQSSNTLIVAHGNFKITAKDGRVTHNHK